MELRVSLRQSERGRRRRFEKWKHGKLRLSEVWQASINKQNIRKSEPMTDGYPVPNRTALRNAQICAHESGHALVGRALGNSVWLVTVVPDLGPNGFEGRCVRSGPVSEMTLSEGNSNQTEQILSICERLESITPELGSARVDLSEYIVISQNNIVELLAGECAELILHPTLPSLGARHDHTEAAAFARVAVAAAPATIALLAYCKAEAVALLTQNRDCLDALVEALIEHGELSGSEVDAVISGAVGARLMATEVKRRVEWAAAEQRAAAFNRQAVPLVRSEAAIPTFPR
jgi:hypothetical protein